MERMAYVLGNALYAIDLAHPLGERPVHAAVVDFLQRLALQHLGADLADEHDHRRGVLKGCVNADRAVRRAGPAGDEQHPGLPGQLAVGLGHVRGAALLPADDEGEPVPQVVQAVEHRQVALARHAERHLHALRHKSVGEDPAAVPRLQVGFHAATFSNSRRSAVQQSATAALAVSRTPPMTMKPWIMSG